MTGRCYYLTTFTAFQRHAARFAESHFISASPSGENPNSANAERDSGAAPILALISADEAAHIALERDADFEPLPHPLARTSVSARVTAALAHFGVVPGDDTFTVAEKLARVHPLLRHRVF